MYGCNYGINYLLCPLSFNVTVEDKGFINPDSYATVSNGMYQCSSVYLNATFVTHPRIICTLSSSIFAGDFNVRLNVHVTVAGMTSNDFSGGVTFVNPRA